MCPAHLRRSVRMRPSVQVKRLGQDRYQWYNCQTDGTSGTHSADLGSRRETHPPVLGGGEMVRTAGEHAR